MRTENFGAVLLSFRERGRRIAHPLRLVLPLLALFVQGSCGPAEFGPVTADLHALFPVAEILTEVDHIDFGLAAARPHLLSGWSVDNRTSKRFPFVWAVGEHSTIQFFLIEPRDLVLSFHCWPYAPRPGKPQVVRLELNGRTIASIELATRAAEFEVAVVAEALVAGRNELSFHYA